MRALLLPVGADWYAVDLQAVREVIILPAVTAVPTAPSPVLGLFNLRGEIVPLFDTAALLGLGGMPRGSFAAIVRTAAGPAGLSLSGMPEAVELGEPEPIDIVSGVAIYSVGARLATLVDVDQVLGPDRVGTFHA